MELNEFELTATTRSHKMCQDRKYQPIDNMLKDHGSNNMDQIVETVSSKDQEFIDHTLLAPEYIRESNNFIMDLMDQQVVFPKSEGNTDPLPNGDSTFNEKEEALNTELQFQNAMFQFVNKHAQIPCSSTDDVGIVESSVNNALSFDKVPSTFMTLNESFLDSGTSVNNKPFCSSSDEANQYEMICDLTRPNKETIDHCGIINDVTMDLPPGSLISDQEFICARLNAKKILPHKKRISKKLKVNQNNYGYGLSAEDCETKDLETRLVEHNALQFSCEICGHATSSQLNFFAHLKLHYEPPAPDPMLPTMKDSLIDHHNDNNVINDKEIVNHVNVEQVFPDVHINFEDFQPAVESVQQQINQQNQDDDIKILNSNSIDKCIQYVTQSAIEPPPKHASVDEIEFSDTEDMLEGIRNVVDKVSIEDTSDALDMVTSTGIRTPWLTLNSFNCLSLKSKLFESPNLNSTVNSDEPPTIPKRISPNVANIEKDPKPFKTKNENGVSFTDEKLTTCLNNQTEYFTITDFELIDAEDDDDNIEDEIGDDNNKVSSKRKYICTKCNREFNSNNALKYHYRTHSGIRAHQCDKCGKSFYAQGALKSHIRTHSDNKPYSCEICGQPFRQMGDLKYHMVSLHNKERNFQCEFCGKAFARQYSLVLHRRIHTNERNYKCTYCTKSFRASIYLQNHTKIHTGEKPYQCKVCSKKFRLTGDLRRHTKIHLRNNAKSDDS